MPLMKGIKFACEPCIRGHRSSKCNHSDRVLVQVRKPGRPLSSCPHILSSSSPGTFVHPVPASTSRESETSENDAGCGGINCSCDVTSVAIPKIASCSCRTLKHNEPSPKPPSLSITPSLSQSPTTASHSEMIASPVSPTSPNIVSASSLISGSTNRISKPPKPKKRNAIAGGTGGGPGRRASVIGEEATLEMLLGKERERSTSAESAKTEKTGSCCGVASIPNGSGHVNGHAVRGFLPVFSPNIEDRADQFHPQQQQFSQLQNGRATAPIENGSLGLKLDMDINDMLAMENWDLGGNKIPSWAQPQLVKKLGCCVNKSPQVQLQHQHMLQAQPTLQTHPCCAGGCSNGSMKSSLPMQQQPVPIPLVPYGTSQFYSPPQFPPPPYITTTNSQQSTSVWPYPPSTINHPLTPQELAWLQQHRAAGVFGQPPPCSVTISPAADGAQVDSWAHSCNCGPGCDCLGCATHPFNRRTVEYVKGIQQFMEGDYHPHPPHNNSHSRPFSQQLSLTQPQQHNEFGSRTSSSSHPTNPTTTADVFNNNATTPVLEASPLFHNDSSHKQEEQSSHQLSPSPSQEGETGAGDTLDGTDNGGDFSPSNFFYVDYPFGTCAQIETGCKCGEGCTCVGCLTHGGHDGVVLEGSVDENRQWGW